MMNLKNLPGQAPDENVVKVLRRHWLTLLPLGFSLLFILLLPIAIAIVIEIIKPDLYSNQALTTLLVLGGSIFLLFAWLFLYQNYIDYYLDIWIVTDRRILNIEQHGLFGRTVSELRLYRVQDVTSEVRGFWKTMFDYGEVYIQTAGEEQRFIFEDIPHPNDAAKLILEMSEVQRKKHLEEAVEEFGMPDKKS
ncbi:PH domain-containing protein [Patescibacteria group bacterium]|nr:PH domain-containing protein [Patescibacteria group bacterium]MBU1629710.1 PH domain-containing protein [Patescibacteria group bacterium]MBU1907951.1 PH domain-containing protein [Patescibacteria group bacterium]